MGGAISKNHGLKTKANKAAKPHADKIAGLMTWATSHRFNLRGGKRSKYPI